MYEMKDRQGMPEAKVHEQRDALVEELFEKMIGAMEVASVYLGDRLGLYRALAQGGPATSSELAQRTGTHERYVREWLEQQAVAGILGAGILTWIPQPGASASPPDTPR